MWVLSCFSCVQLFLTPWTVAYQVPLSMGFSRQEYWSGLPFPSPRDLPDPGMEHKSLMSPALVAGGFFTTSPILSSVQLLSRVRLFVTPWTAARQASLSITNSQSLLKLMSIESSDAIQPSHPLSSPSPPAFNLSQHQGLFQ